MGWLVHFSGMGWWLLKKSLPRCYYIMWTQHSTASSVIYEHNLQIFSFLRWLRLPNIWHRERFKYTGRKKASRKTQKVTDTDADTGCLADLKEVLLTSSGKRILSMESLSLWRWSCWRGKKVFACFPHLIRHMSRIDAQPAEFCIYLIRLLILAPLALHSVDQKWISG